MVSVTVDGKESTNSCHSVWSRFLSDKELKALKK